MDLRLRELTDLRAYIDTIDKETTLFLQSLQWDYTNLTESKTMVCCKYIADHKIPMETREAHEEQCYLTLQGYAKGEVLLPDPINPDANTVIKLSKQDIMRVISAASSSDPSFKRAPLTHGIATPGTEPLSVERLQQTYSADERRAIYDAVVSAAPACHDLTDLALPSTSSGSAPNNQKSRVEILAELRDMKRRRAKYRVASKTTNYSDTLRDVIKTQMELYSEAKGIFIKTEYGSKNYVSLNKPEPTQAEKMPTNIVIKQERISPESDYYSEARKHRKRSRSRERQNRHTKNHNDREYGSRNRQDYSVNDDASEKQSNKDYSKNREKYSSKEKRRIEDERPKSHRSFEEKKKYDSWDAHYNKGKHRDVNEIVTKTDQNNSSSGPSSRRYKERNRGEVSSRDSGNNDYYEKQNDYKTSNRDSNRYREQCHDGNIKEEQDDYYRNREQKDYKRSRDIKEKGDVYDHTHDRRKRMRES